MNWRGWRNIAAGGHRARPRRGFHRLDDAGEYAYRPRLVRDGAPGLLGHATTTVVAEPEPEAERPTGRATVAIAAEAAVIAPVVIKDMTGLRPTEELEPCPA